MDNTPKLFDAAILAEETGQVRKALRLYEKAAALDKDAPGLRIRWAALLHDQGRWLEAIKIARQVTRRWIKSRKWFNWHSGPGNPGTLKVAFNFPAASALR